MGNDEEFFQNLFIYLKGKFPYKLSALENMQKNIQLNIYHETIVALEQVHEVLRQVEKGIAPTREDYEKAVKDENHDRQQEIRSFYQKLFLVSSSPSPKLAIAFDDFLDHYYWDSIIQRYKLFIQQNQNLYAEFNELRVWDSQKFQEDKIFKFIEKYQLSLLEEDTLPKIIQDNIANQNQQYETLIQDYDELTSRNVKIGVSLFDVAISSFLRIEDDGSFSIGDLFEVFRRLEDFLIKNDAILMQINHIHMVAGGRCIVSYLLVYKATVYKNPKDLVDLVESLIYRFVGSISANKIKVIDREDLLKKLYPNEIFTGELSKKAERLAFRNKFLKYFLSCMFLINFDKKREFVHHEDIYHLFFNDYVFYKQKLYVTDKPEKLEPVIDDKQVRSKKIQYLDELVNDIDQNTLDKYFNFKDFPTEALEQMKLMEFLYKQQITKEWDKVINIDGLLKVESFLARLMFLPINEFKQVFSSKKFVESPKFSQLSLLFQQFILISSKAFLKSGDVFAFGLDTKATNFLKQYKEDFHKDYLLTRLEDLKIDLEKYKDKLRSDFIKEKKWSDKACKKNEKSIQDYLAILLQENVIVMRFIFECGEGRRSLDEAKLFDEMFRDYIENLKRRSKNKVCLKGHVGVYIASRIQHQIDATLFFNQNNHYVDPKVLRDDIIQYWENYVNNKSAQIQTYRQKHPQKEHSKDEKNSFAHFKDAALTATVMPIVSTENILNHEYIEISNNQKKFKEPLIKNVAKFYAYCFLILYTDGTCPRKNPLILGRIRTPHKAKVSLAPEKTDIGKISNDNKNVMEPVADASSSLNNHAEVEIVPAKEKVIALDTEKMTFMPVKKHALVFMRSDIRYQLKSDK